MCIYIQLMLLYIERTNPGIYSTYAYCTKETIFDLYILHIFTYCIFNLYMVLYIQHQKQKYKQHRKENTEMAEMKKLIEELKKEGFNTEQAEREAEKLQITRQYNLFIL